MKKSFPYSGQNLTGILRYFYDNDNANYFDIVRTYTSSNHSDNNLPVNAINFADDNKYWHAKDKDKIGNYFVIYLKNYYINLEGYTIQTSAWDPGSGICH